MVTNEPGWENSKEWREQASDRLIWIAKSGAN